MSNELVGREEDTVWLQRDPVVVKEFSDEKRQQEYYVRGVVLPMMAEADLVSDHVYDPTTEWEHLIIHRVLWTPKIRQAFLELGWKEKYKSAADPDERKDFYDALLKGGTLK